MRPLGRGIIVQLMFVFGHHTACCSSAYLLTNSKAPHANSLSISYDTNYAAKLRMSSERVAVLHETAQLITVVAWNHGVIPAHFVPLENTDQHG